MVKREVTRMGDSEEYTKALVGKGGLTDIRAARKKYEKKYDDMLESKLAQFKTAAEKDAYLKGRIDVREEKMMLNEKEIFISPDNRRRAEMKKWHDKKE
jgi:hypothetical protein